MQPLTQQQCSNTASLAVSVLLNSKEALRCLVSEDGNSGAVKVEQMNSV